MTAKEPIEEKLENLSRAIGSDDSLLESVMNRIDAEPHRSRNLKNKLILRRFIMNPFTKLTAAAMILIAVLIVINQFGGSIDGATVAYAQITENMRKMPWMHGVVEGAGEKFEAWFSFEKRVMVSKRIPGEIRYHDSLKNIVQVYDPDANTIKVSYPTTDALVGVGQSVVDFPKMILKLFDEKGEKVIQETGKYKGKDSKIYKMSGFLGGMDMKVEMIVDRDKNVLLYINQKAFDKDGTLKIEANAYFDYPENGPNNIYEVGVPASAKIVSSEKEKAAFGEAFAKAITVIDNMGNWPEPRDLVVEYWKDRNAKNYDKMAIFWPGSAIWNIQSLEKNELIEYEEEPIEYVFGKAQATEIKGHIIVPYAAKNYFEKNGKYNLKMRLSNEKSAKERYYIVSGN